MIGYKKIGLTAHPLQVTVTTRLALAFLTSCLLPAALFAQSRPGQGNAVSDTQLRNRITQLVNKQAEVRSVSQVTISPDGKNLAWSVNDPRNGRYAVYYAPVNHPEKALRVTASSDDRVVSESDPRWSPDSKKLAFLSDREKPGQAQLFITAISGGSAAPAQVSNFDGYISNPKWSPKGDRISLLYVQKADRAPSPFAAKNNNTGIIDSLINNNIQRLAVIDPAARTFEQVTPPSLYIFEHDWSPDGKNITYTAAPPPGDDNWYIAELYTQQLSSRIPVVLYHPSGQIALPRWSPDGKKIAFIEGLMSDQGGTGGEIYSISVKGGYAENLTPGRKSSPSWFTWRQDGTIAFTEFAGGSSGFCQLNINDKTVKRLWVLDESIRAGPEDMSLSITADIKHPLVAVIRTSWASLPEIWTGGLSKQTRFSNFNKDIRLDLPKSENIIWANEGFNVQGWLLYPANYNPSKKYPLLVNVHGGPAWIARPSWISHDFNGTLYTQLGYFVFFPNPRGSYGQGEKFTVANRRDWGYGDLRDILIGVDKVVKTVSVDPEKTGLLGWSYGGSTAMFAVTQTNRFKAVVAGAGAADWLSYYGQNSIDKWMKPYFGASPYDDPAAYARCSAMTFIKQAKTPALILAGEFDGESPPTQAFQFWHALKELGTPAQLIVYPDEGHGFYRSADRIDVTLRSLQWFNFYLKP